MAIADIIKEIDAYVLSLRHARELLLPTSESGHKEKLNLKKRAPAPSGKPPMLENESRISRPATVRKILKERVEPVPVIHRSVSRHDAKTGQPEIAPADLPQAQNAPQETLSSIETNSSVRSVRGSIRKPAFGRQANHVKPAIALAGSMDSRIVVVSAQEAQRERDQAAQSQVRRPRVPAVGRTGRLAFEALFRDETDPSKAPDR